MKVTKLHYIFFKRRKGPKSNIDFLIVPSLLARALWNPIDYQKRINGIELCDFIDDNLIINIEKTKEERKKLILRSPKIIGLNTEEKVRLFVKTDCFEELIYKEFDGHLIKPFTQYDYICKSIVASTYLNLSKNDFQALKNSGKLGVYRSYYLSHFQKKTKDLHTLKYPKKRCGAQFFLLEELNKFRPKNLPQKVLD